MTGEWNASEATSDRPKGPALRWQGIIPALLFGALFLAVALVNLAYSLRAGPLASPPTYDDVRYLSDALDRVVFASGSGLWSVLGSIWTYPPHSFVTTLTAAAGFWALGPAPVAAYIANLWIFALYVAVCARFSRPLEDLTARLLFVAGLCYVPVAHAMITEFRPDMAAGLLFGLALWLTGRTDFGKASVRDVLLLAVVAVSATVMKPSGTVLVIPGLGIALAIKLAFDLSMSAGRRAGVVRGALKVAGLYLLLMVPFAIAFGAEAVSYIAGTLLTGSDIWVTPGSRWFHLTYHLIGPGAQEALGAFLIPVLVLVVADLALSVRSAAWRQAAPFPFYAALAVVGLAMGLSAEKTVYQGSYFYLPMLLAAISAFVRLAVALKDRWKERGPAGLKLVTGGILVLCLLFLPLGSSYLERPKDGWQTQRLMADLADIVFDFAKRDLSVADACNGHVPVLTTLDYEPLSPDLIRFVFATGGLRVQADSVFFPRSLEEALSSISQADFVVMADPSTDQKNKWIRIGAYADEIYKALSERPGMNKIQVGVYEGKPYWLFMNMHCSLAISG